MKTQNEALLQIKQLQNRATDVKCLKCKRVVANLKDEKKGVISENRRVIVTLWLVCVQSVNKVCCVCVFVTHFMLLDWLQMCCYSHKVFSTSVICILLVILRHHVAKIQKDTECTQSLWDFWQSLKDIEEFWCFCLILRWLMVYWLSTNDIILVMFVSGLKFVLQPHRLIDWLNLSGD